MRGLLALLCLCASAQSLPKVYTAEDGVIPPKAIERDAPSVTPQGRLAQVQGSVLITCVVNADGSLRDAHITRGLGLGLDHEALDAVKRWKFLPGTKDGVPVAVLTTVEVNFRALTSRTDWHTGRAVFDTPPGATQPVLLEPDFPPPSRADLNADALIDFDLDEHGVPVNLHVERASDERTESEALAAVKAWRFAPAMKDGKPVAVRGAVELVHGVAAVRPG